MKIIKLQAENIKKLKAVEITPDGNVVKITGRNEQGKTTVLDSIWWALGGTKNIQEQPIREGQKKANITLNLGDIIVTRKFTSSGTTLEVVNKDGLKFPSPQAMLDKLIGKFSFDPLVFAKADKKTQVNTLLGIVDISLDAAKLKEIAGVSVVVEQNPLDSLNIAYKRLYETRAEIGRDLTRTKKVLEDMDPVKETKHIDVAELVAEKEKLQRENQTNEQKRTTLENSRTTLQNKTTKAEGFALEIKRLQAELEALQASIASETTLLSEQEFEISLLADHDLTDINNRVATVDENNRMAQAWENHKEKESDVDMLQGEYDGYTAKLDGIKNYKEELIKGTRFPIDGLDFGNGGVLYKGLPFEQASSAQKLQVSLAIAMALNPDLRVIRIDNGSLLDSVHMAVIEKMAKEKDFQIWCEMVDESGKVGVYIEDGAVKEVNREAV